MAMVYHCKHCGRTVGKLEAPGLSTSTLGLNQLSAEDRKRMLTYEENGDVSIQTICESCEQTLVEYPHYYELDHFLQ